MCARLGEIVSGKGEEDLIDLNHVNLPRCMVRTAVQSYRSILSTHPLHHPIIHLHLLLPCRFNRCRGMLWQGVEERSYASRGRSALLSNSFIYLSTNPPIYPPHSPTHPPRPVQQTKLHLSLASKPGSPIGPACPAARLV